MTPELGSLEWQDDKHQSIRARVDMCALEINKVRMISVVGDIFNVKAMRAGMATSLDCLMYIKCNWDRADGTTFEQQMKAFPVAGGYHLSAHRLGYDQVHAIFWSRANGLLFNDSDAVLWAEMKSKRFTTPLLRGWLPYLKAELVKQELIAPCLNSGGAKCMVLRASTMDLDKIVEDGLRNGLLQIREDAA